MGGLLWKEYSLLLQNLSLLHHSNLLSLDTSPNSCGICIPSASCFPATHPHPYNRRYIIPTMGCVVHRHYIVYICIQSKLNSRQHLPESKSTPHETQEIKDDPDTVPIDHVHFTIINTFPFHCTSSYSFGYSFRRRRTWIASATFLSQRRGSGGDSLLRLQDNARSVESMI